MTPDTMPPDAVFQTDLPGLIARGKVRDIYDLGDRLMIVASDRISAFDVVMDQPVPGKGVVLTRMSEFWLAALPAASPHHLEYVADERRVPPGYEPHARMLAGRAMVCRKARVLPIECVARGYIIGGGWKEYTQTGRISGIPLPAGLRPADRLPAPLFTPSTKAASGHDEPISFERACELADEFLKAADDAPAQRGFRDGRELMESARARTLAIYSQATAHAESRGLILADTKFEFGLHEGVLMLVDEVLTPDSSRFWPAQHWRPGENPPSFDKQFLRDYLNSLDWPKTPPPPRIPETILQQTAVRYREAYRLLTEAEIRPQERRDGTVPQ